MAGFQKSGAFSKGGAVLLFSVLLSGAVFPPTSGKKSSDFEDFDPHRTRGVDPIPEKRELYLQDLKELEIIRRNRGAYGGGDGDGGEGGGSGNSNSSDGNLSQGLSAMMKYQVMGGEMVEESDGRISLNLDLSPNIRSRFLAANAQCPTNFVCPKKFMVSELSQEEVDDLCGEGKGEREL